MSPALVEDDGGLSPEQTRALFDILTHYKTRAEIESLKLPEAVAGCGYPFSGTTGSSASGSASSSASSLTQQSDGGDDATAPLLQAMLVQFFLPLPGLEGLPREFWSERVQTMLMRLAEADLSESYDKGAPGTRRRLATCLSVVLEKVARGLTMGLAPVNAPVNNVYDTGRAEDLERAWDDVLQGLVYGDLVDELFAHMGRTEDLESHSPAVESAVDYLIMMLATLMHQLLVDSPEGQRLVGQLEYMNSLVPWRVIKQTMRVGNAATMVAGLTRLLLAKMSLGGITSKLGLTSKTGDVMNLLQRIISLGLSWDAGDFRQQADRIAKAKARDRPSDEVLGLLREHAAAGRERHVAVRAASARNSQSIVTAVLAEADPGLAGSLSDAQHTQCLDYYAALLAVRDREAVTAVFCRQQPDVLTPAVRDLVGSYDAVIRSVHAGVDIRGHLDDLQAFLGDLITTSKPDKAGRLPSVNDFVKLLRRSKGLLFRFLHAVAARCPDVVASFRQWSNDSVVRFRQRADMADRLNHLFCSLKPATRASVRRAVDDHAAYLAALASHSRESGQALVSGRTEASPGVYLLRWRALLDETPLTPTIACAPVRHGRDIDKLGDVKMGSARPKSPDVECVVEALGSGFSGIVREVTKDLVASRG